MNKNNIKEHKQTEESFNIDSKNENFLVLHNDDYHTIDYVIEALMEICKHDIIQAEQCTFIVHYKGKCEVKKGVYHVLKPMKEELINRGLKASIV